MALLHLQLMMLERRLAVAERARQRDMQQLSERSASMSSPSRGGGGELGSSDEMGEDSFTPRTVWTPDRSSLAVCQRGLSKSVNIAQHEVSAEHLVSWTSGVAAMQLQKGLLSNSVLLACVDHLQEVSCSCCCTPSSLQTLRSHVLLQPGSSGMPGMDGANGRQVRKQGETLDKLQRQFATLESRFVDYQEAQAAMAQVGGVAGCDTFGTALCWHCSSGAALQCTCDLVLAAFYTSTSLRIGCASVAHANGSGVLTDAVSLN